MSAAFRSKSAAHDFDADVSALWSPGPGAYEFDSFQGASDEGGTQAFKSRRWQPRAQTPTPGPGHYKPFAGSPSFAVRTPVQRIGGAHPAQPRTDELGNAFVWTRRPTAPSIPSLQLAMGYEEDADGHLVPQEAPPPPKGTPAPDRYSPNVAITLSLIHI